MSETNNIGGRLNSWLVTCVVKELKLGISVLQVQLVVKLGLTL